MKKIIEILKTVFFHKVENKMDSSKEKAPYTGLLELNGSVDEAAVNEAVAELTGQSVDTVNHIVAGYQTIVVDNLAKGYKVQSHIGDFLPHITKSFPTQDAAFDPERNELIGVCRVNDATRNWVGDIVPKEHKDARADLGGPSIISVFTDGLGYSKCAKDKTFRIVGSGFPTVIDANNKVTLTHIKTGVVTTLTNVTPSGNGLRLDCKFTEDIALGDNLLTVTKEDVPATRNVEVK